MTETFYATQQVRVLAGYQPELSVAWSGVTPVPLTKLSAMELSKQSPAAPVVARYPFTAPAVIPLTM